MKILLLCLGLASPVIGFADEPASPKRVLVFSKSAGYEHAIVYRDTAWPSFLEREMLKIGIRHNIDFIFSKDGSLFTPENIATFDAFLFYTSGDLTHQPRDGQGDNYPLMTLEGKNALLKAIQDGKGFIGVHSAVATFPRSSSTSFQDSPAIDPYHEMLGAQFIGHNREQNGPLILVDRKFPGMEAVPPDFAAFDEWPAMKNFAQDLHVIAVLDCREMTGNLYQRPNFPVVWARMENKGRVFFTAMGHDEEIWKNSIFRQMLVGGVQWATGQIDADVTPNIKTATPHASEIPLTALKVIHSPALK
ncbi:MAG TPA: ThuA domain-containing protein [Verrucomicrobiae bacterium]|nr:ThuA domain-containing protein [Verrucomicrobiae bacterium]